MLTIVGLIGAKGAGKSTFSCMLREVRSGATERALANKLKDVCAEVFNIEREHFDDPAYKERYTGTIAFGHAEPIFLSRNNVATLLDEFRLPINDDTVERHIGRYLYTPRQVMQYVGTEVLRSVDPDVHCRGVMQDAPKDGVLIVPDVRFPNEMEFFERLEAEGKTISFFSVYVQRASAEAEASKDSHSSESHLKALADRADFVVENEGSVEALRTKVGSLATVIAPPSKEIA